MPKTATLGPIRVDAKLREAAEKLLGEGETLSSFIEAAFRAQVEQRQVKNEFLERALASRDKAYKTNTFIAAEEVHGKLKNIIEEAKDKS